MQLTIDIPDDIAERLRAAQGGDLPRSAIERIALAGYLDGTLSRYHVQRLLGFDNRWDAEEWLGARGASVQYSLADLDQDRSTLDRLFAAAKP